ncbi:hypothetical protein E7L51_07650 [Corynebacterium amycolatum]|uniref:restriction endonuclease subunit S n=1 Tax=Corynebacterium amycolatum TaxID=43765 RepID=UPI0011EC308F|nr:restriction endonuclease subunit S [Corynebacterium amycolatum]KAA0881452.1 hypothetical protein E7L51_07650 [Corynebacterium amycolatum]
MSQWPMVKLGDVARKTSQVNPKKFPDEDFCLYSIPAYDAGCAEYLTGKEIGSSKPQLQAGDVLLSKIVPHIRRSWVVESHDIRTLGSSEWIVFNDSRFDPNFLREYFLSDQFHHQFMTTVAGVGGSLNRARPAAVFNLSVPLPPLEEQRKISKVLAKSKKSTERERVTIDRLKETLNAVFNQRFGSPYQNQKHLPVLKLSELAVVKTGNTPPRRVTENYGSYIPWAKSDNLGDWGITTPEESLSEQGAQKGRIAEPGSILVTCIAGSINSIGKSSLIEQEVAFNQQINSLTPKPEISSSAFLFAALNSYPELVRDKSTGGVKGIVKKSAFEDIALPVPPMHEQHWFSQFFENLKTIVRLQSRKLALLEELHQSLATRAFAGQL